MSSDKKRKQEESNEGKKRRTRGQKAAEKSTDDSHSEIDSEPETNLMKGQYFKWLILIILNSQIRIRFNHPLDKRKPDQAIDLAEFVENLDDFGEDDNFVIDENIGVVQTIRVSAIREAMK